MKGAERVTVDGQAFDSKRESRRWMDLLTLAKAGRISNLQRQVRIPLIGKNEGLKTPTGKQMHYVADFQYYDHDLNAWVVEDAKGWATDVYKMKRAVLAAQGVEVLET